MDFSKLLDYIEEIDGKWYTRWRTDHWGNPVSVEDSHPLSFSGMPPDDGNCRKCYEWRMFPPGQRQFGWAWWKYCDRYCECEHHKDEIWLA